MNRTKSLFCKYFIMPKQNRFRWTMLWIRWLPSCASRVVATTTITAAELSIPQPLLHTSNCNISNSKQHICHISSRSANGCPSSTSTTLFVLRNFHSNRNSNNNKWCMLSTPLHCRPELCPAVLCPLDILSRFRRWVLIKIIKQFVCWTTFSLYRFLRLIPIHKNNHRNCNNRNSNLYCHRNISNILPSTCIFIVIPAIQVLLKRNIHNFRCLFFWILIFLNLENWLFCRPYDKLLLLEVLRSKT